MTSFARAPGSAAGFDERPDRVEGRVAAVEDRLVQVEGHEISLATNFGKFVIETRERFDGLEKIVRQIRDRV